MADSTYTQTGRNELRSSIEQFPANVTAALRKVAQGTANAVAVRARQLLRSQQKTDSTKLMADITVEEDAANKQFIVVSRSPIGQPTNVNLWNEHGTVRMGARPYMRPAAQAENSRYQTEMQAAALSAARETFGN